MSRTFGTLLMLVTCVSPAPHALAAEPDRPADARPIWGTVTIATADSVTVAPELAVRRNRKAPDQPAEKPAERTYALSKDGTEFMFAEVGMKRLMNDGTTLRTLTDPEPAAAADLKVGQLVQITPGDDRAARQVIIAWSTPGSIVKVNGDSITFRPADAEDDEEQTLTISNTTTRVVLARSTGDRPSPTGRGAVRTIEYKSGTLADLKPDQSVVVCIRDETAVKIRIHVADGSP